MRAGGGARPLQKCLLLRARTLLSQLEACAQHRLQPALHLRHATAEEDIGQTNAPARCFVVVVDGGVDTHRLEKARRGGVVVENINSLELGLMRVIPYIAQHLQDGVHTALLPAPAPSTALAIYAQMAPNWYAERASLSQLKQRVVQQRQCFWLQLTL
jgi:hypothetical protein